MLNYSARYFIMYFAKISSSVRFFLVSVYNFIESAKHKRHTLTTVVRINRQETGRGGVSHLQLKDEGGLEQKTLTTQRVPKMYDNTDEGGQL